MQATLMGANTVRDQGIIYHAMGFKPISGPRQGLEASPHPIPIDKISKQFLSISKRTRN